MIAVNDADGLIEDETKLKFPILFKFKPIEFSPNCSLITKLSSAKGKLELTDASSLVSWVSWVSSVSSSKDSSF